MNQRLEDSKTEEEKMQREEAASLKVAIAKLEGEVEVSNNQLIRLKQYSRADSTKQRQEITDLQLELQSSLTFFFFFFFFFQKCHEFFQSSVREEKVSILTFCSPDLLPQKSHQTLETETRYL